MKQTVLALIAPLALLACTAEEPTPSPDLAQIATADAMQSDAPQTGPDLRPAPAAAVPTDGDQCGAVAHQDLVGQPQAALDDLELPETTRIIPPGAAVTMDFRPDRLNIQIGDDGLIESVHCV